MVFYTWFTKLTLLKFGLELVLPLFLGNKCKVLLHEKCMPECQTLLICFWFNVCFFHSTLLLHLALH